MIFRIVLGLFAIVTQASVGNVNHLRCDLGQIGKVRGLDTKGQPAQFPVTGGGAQQRTKSCFGFLKILIHIQKYANVSDQSALRTRIGRHGHNGRIYDCVNCAIDIGIDGDALLIPFARTDIRPIVLGRYQCHERIRGSDANMPQIHPSAPFALYPNAFKIFPSCTDDQDLFTAQHCRPDLLVIRDALRLRDLTAEHAKSAACQLSVYPLRVLIKVHRFAVRINDLIVVGGKTDLNAYEHVVFRLFA